MLDLKTAGSAAGVLFAGVPKAWAGGIYADDAPETADPTPAQLALLRGPVCAEMLDTYPEFCSRVWRNAA